MKTPCPDCGKPTEQSVRMGGQWVHTETGSVKCHPEKGY